jgi:hypothetical protein
MWLSVKQFKSQYPIHKKFISSSAATGCGGVKRVMRYLEINRLLVEGAKTLPEKSTLYK